MYCSLLKDLELKCVIVGISDLIARNYTCTKHVGEHFNIVCAESPSVKEKTEN